MLELNKLTMGDMIRCGADVRRLGASCNSLEMAANEIVSYFYDNFRESESGRPSCVLARMYQTIPYHELPDELQQFALGVLGPESIAPETKCLTLLATRGEEPAWNSRAKSSGHKAIPLPSAEIVSRFPMIAQLIDQFGIELKYFLEISSTHMVDREEKSYNVFFVPEAHGSPSIPAQENFVVPYGVRSVLGFGGLYPNGEMYAFILFCRHKIAYGQADLFKTIGLSAKLPLQIHLDRGRIFEAQ